jgi:hypothetical protein
MRQTVYYTPNDAQDTTGIGSVLDVRDFKMIVVSISTSGNADLTVKTQGAIVENLDNIDFTASATPTNSWGYVGLYPYDSATFIPGSTGVVFTGTDGSQLYEINVSGLTALAFNVTSHSDGEVTVKVVGFTNQ